MFAVSVVKADTRVIKIESKDGVVFEIGSAVTRESLVICHFLECTSINEVVPIPDLKASILDKIIKFCLVFESEPDFEADADGYFIVPDYDCPGVTFLLQFDNEEIRQLLFASQYLDIPRLILYCSYVFWTQVSGVPLSEMVDYFDEPFTRIDE